MKYFGFRQYYYSSKILNTLGANVTRIMSFEILMQLAFHHEEENYHLSIHSFRNVYFLRSVLATNGRFVDFKLNEKLNRYNLVVVTPY